jgi:hypothetical protein
LIDKRPSQSVRSIPPATFISLPKATRAEVIAEIMKTAEAWGKPMTHAEAEATADAAIGEAAAGTPVASSVTLRAAARGIRLDGY